MICSTIFLLLICVFTGCSGFTAYNSVKTDYETFLTAYEDTSSSGRSISAGPIIPKDTTSSPLVISLSKYFLVKEEKMGETDMALYAIMDFDAVEGKLELVGSISMEWTDEVKTLKGVSFTSTAESMFFTQDQIWTPNLVLINSADSIKSIGDETYKIRYNMSSGLCQWNPRILILASCTPDATYFPFDEQRCTMSVQPWGQDSSLVSLQVTGSTWDTGNVQGSSIWTLESTKSSVTLLGNTYVADFEIIIKRKPLFTTLVIVLPVLLLSLLTGFLFLLPPASGERMGFGITCFLAFIVLLQTLMQLLPDSSDPMSLLCYYVILMLTLSGCLSIVNVFLLRLYMSPGKDEVPKAFIYFYKTVKCRPCRFCYRKTKTKLKPPCMTFIEKVRSTSVRCYQYIRRLLCPTCRRVSYSKRNGVQDTVHNNKFSTKTLHKRMSLASSETPILSESSLDRDGMSIRSRKLVSGNEVVTSGDIELTDQGQGFQYLSRSNTCRSTSKLTDVENTESIELMVDGDGFEPKTLLDVNEKDRRIIPGSSSDNSSGYNSSAGSSTLKISPKIPKQKNDVSGVDIAVISDVDDVDDDDDADDHADDDDYDSDDELEATLSSITWEFVGQVLDYFFIVTFIGLQVTFTFFFLVPIGARY